jgi:hypothetical protein
MDYYEILELSNNASLEMVELAYSLLKERYNPNKYTGDKTIWAAEKLKEITNAYDIIMGESKNSINTCSEISIDTDRHIPNIIPLQQTVTSSEIASASNNSHSVDTSSVQNDELSNIPKKSDRINKKWLSKKVFLICCAIIVIIASSIIIPIMRHEIYTAGNWIYYINRSDGNKLYKIKTDGTLKIKLADEKCSETFISGDWVYYYNETAIYKIRTDGTHKTKIINNNGTFINIEDDWIYYANEKDNLKIYKVKTDGTNSTKVNDDTSINIKVKDSWIYYSNDSDNGCLYKIKTDGSSKTKLNNDFRSLGIQVVNDWIYYSPLSMQNIGAVNDIYKLFKIKTDGTNRTKISNDECLSACISGDWIYYSKSVTFQNNISGSNLYKIKTDGSNNTKLCDYGPGNGSIYVIGDWIFYAMKYDGNKLYRIKTDGSNNTKLSDNACSEIFVCSSNFTN